MIFHIVNLTKDGRIEYSHSTFLGLSVGIVVPLVKPRYISRIWMYNHSPGYNVDCLLSVKKKDVFHLSRNAHKVSSYADSKLLVDIDSKTGTRIWVHSVSSDGTKKTTGFDK